MIDYIYALIESESKTKFYIGRTENMERRMREHRYGARIYRAGDELKYQYASTLNTLGIAWEMELLMECQPGSEHYEDYFVNKFRHEPLQNMKAGDSEPWMGRDYSSPEEFVAYRALELHRQATRAPVVRVKRESHDQERTLMVGEKPNERFISPWMRERLKKR